MERTLNAFKNGLKCANGCKIYSIKNKTKKELATANAQESANGATINAFEVHLTIKVLIYLNINFKIKICTKKMHLRMH